MGMNSVDKAAGSIVIVYGTLCALNFEIGGLPKMFASVHESTMCQIPETVILALTTMRSEDLGVHLVHM